MPNSFANDGAFGAGGPGMSTAPASGAAATPAVSPSSTAAPSSPASGGGALEYSGGATTSSPSFTPQAIPSASPSSSSGGASTSSGGVPQSPYQFLSPGMTNTAGGVFFEGGGSVPDDASQSQQTDPMDVILQRAVGSAKSVLLDTYKQFGLSSGTQDQTGGVQEDGGGQQAANMPAVPASQSESGVKPLQPAPGQLPPTSNPFGKRADASQQGGIQDDETQESA